MTEKRAGVQIPASRRKRHENGSGSAKTAYSRTIREADIVKGIYDGLTLRGRTVFRVGQWRADRGGNDVDTPDIFVWCPIRLGYIGIEVKTPKGTVRPGQKVLADAGKSVIVRSIEEAFDVVGEVMT